MSWSLSEHGTRRSTFDRRVARTEIAISSPDTRICGKTSTCDFCERYHRLHMQTSKAEITTKHTALCATERRKIFKNWSFDKLIINNTNIQINYLSNCTIFAWQWLGTHLNVNTVLKGNRQLRERETEVYIYICIFFSFFFIKPLAKCERVCNIQCLKNRPTSNSSPLIRVQSHIAQEPLKYTCTCLFIRAAPFSLCILVSCVTIHNKRKWTTRLGTR